MIHETQSGFRPGFFTASAPLNVTDDWLNNIDQGNYIGLAMLDLQKAFDTVDHVILLKNLVLIICTVML